MGRASRLPNDDQLESLIEALYDAALTPSEWPSALKAMSDAFSAEAAGIQGSDKPTGDLTFAVTHNLEDFVALYAQSLLPQDPRVGHIQSHPECRVAYDYLHTSEREMDRSEYYRLFERETGLRYYVGAKCLDTNTDEIMFSLQFPAAHGHVDEELVRRFSPLRNHIARAVTITQKLENLNLRARALGDAVDALSTGVVLIQASGHIVQANQAAEAVFRARDGLTSAPDGLRAARHDEHQRLRQAIRSVSQSRLLRSEHQAAQFLISRPSGAPPYEVLVAPARQSMHFPRAQDVAALLLISAPQSSAQLPTAMLQEHYGLTAAESRLCQTVADGKDAELAARELNIAASTARTRLKQVMSKTDTHRQSELIALLGKLRSGWVPNSL